MQVLKGLLREEEEIWKESKLCLKGKIHMSTSSRKPKWLFEESAQLRDGNLRLKKTWTDEIGNKEILMWPSMKPIETSNLKDWSTKRINELIRLREREREDRTGNEK